MVIHENFPICIGKKIAFAVYRNAELLERIDRIKKLVDDIEAASKLLAKEIVMKYGDESPTYRTYLTQQFYTKTKKLWLDLANAYQGLSKQHVNWGHCCSGRRGQRICGRLTTSGLSRSSSSMQEANLQRKRRLTGSRRSTVSTIDKEWI